MSLFYNELHVANFARNALLFIKILKTEGLEHFTRHFEY